MIQVVLRNQQSDIKQEEELDLGHKRQFRVLDVQSFFTAERGQREVLAAYTSTICLTGVPMERTLLRLASDWTMPTGMR